MPGSLTLTEALSPTLGAFFVISGAFSPLLGGIFAIPGVFSPSGHLQQHRGTGC